MTNCKGPLNLFLLTICILYEYMDWLSLFKKFLLSVFFIMRLHCNHYSTFYKIYTHQNTVADLLRLMCSEVVA